jgi:hypothetical protein
MVRSVKGVEGGRLSSIEQNVGDAQKRAGPIAAHGRGVTNPNLPADISSVLSEPAQGGSTTTTHSPLVHELAASLAISHGTPWDFVPGGASDDDPYYRDATALLPLIERKVNVAVARNNRRAREAIARVESDSATGGLLSFGAVVDAIREAAERPTTSDLSRTTDIDDLPAESIITAGDSVAVRKDRGWSIAGQIGEHTNERLLELLDTVHFTVLRIGRDL